MELIPFLQNQVPLFAGFDTATLEQIAEQSELKTFEGSEAIIACGDEGRFFGVLVSGHARISVTDGTGSRETLCELREGDVFGEMALLTGDRSITDIIAGNRCFVLMIPRQTFNSLILSNPQAVTFLSRLLASRTRLVAVDLTSRQLHERAVSNASDPYQLNLRADVAGKLLTLNIGLQQIRFGVYDTQDDSLDVQGRIHPVGGGCHITLVAGGKITHLEHAEYSLDDLFPIIFESILSLGDRYLFTPYEVVAVGHRVVHGGGKFSSSVVITPQVLDDIAALSIFAPEHNPVNLDGIRRTMKFLPDVPHVAVFDTAFHQTLPPYAYLYGLPYDWYKKEGIRRYGFHGTSHRFVSLKAAEIARRPLGEMEIISCHLGGAGASICAIDHGRSVDTTMGMTPSDGIIMPCRAGNIDPNVITHLMRHYQMSADEIENLINNQSGLKGISGISADIREIEAAASAGHHRALLAHKTFCYQIRKNIGAYVAAMGGVDVLAFTGEIGETSPAVRSLACQGLAYMGIKIDEEKNRKLEIVGSDTMISTDDSPVKIMVIVNNDDRLLAWETLRTLERSEITLTLKAQPPEPVPIEISAHHVHLAQAEVDQLFGQDYQLTPEIELSQPGQFACKEKVNLIGPKGKITGVRVLGPTRKETQVEIAMTEQFKIGVQPPIRESGDLADTPGLTLEGPVGSVAIPRGVICAQRHIHMSPDDAMRFRVRDKYVVQVRVATGERELIFGDVVVRVNPNYRLAMHIDTDEGNAANITTGMKGYIEQIQSRG